MTQNRDIRIPDQSIGRLRLLEKTLRYVGARSRITPNRNPKALTK
jgi:hypothetical protein